MGYRPPMRTFTLIGLCVAGPAWADIPPPEPAETPAALPDYEASAIRGRCETAPVKTTEKPPAGADQTYVGLFTVAPDGAVTGTETRLLFANEAWKKSPGEDGKVGHDCVNVWTVTGTKVDATCAGCSFGITFEANIDYGRSTCPQRLVVDGNHYRAAYDVKVAPDGSFELTFQQSGKPLGTGRFVGDTYAWTSDHRCVWL